MIPFSGPAVNMKMAEYMKLAELWTVCSSCAGFCCGLGKEFFAEGIKEVDDVITPKLEVKAANINHRTIQANGNLFWFAEKVHLYTCVHGLYYILLTLVAFRGWHGSKKGAL